MVLSVIGAAMVGGSIAAYTGALLVGPVAIVAAPVVGSAAALVAGILIATKRPPSASRRFLSGSPPDVRSPRPAHG